MTNKAQRLAWREMYRQRHCPSSKVLLSGSAEAQKHLRTCSYCRSVLENLEENEKMGALFMKLPLPKVEVSLVRVGDVREVQPHTDAKDWHNEEGFFFNPPLVFVLDTNDEFFVQVAQVFTEHDLMSEGDLDIGRGLIAQCWNTYSLPKENLSDKAYTSLDPSLAQQVLERSRQPFPLLDDNTILYHFRSEEIELGSFFSVALNFQKVSEIEAALEAKEQEAAQTQQQPIPFTPSEDFTSSTSRLGLLMQMPWPQPTAMPLAAASKISSDNGPAQRCMYVYSHPDIENAQLCVDAAEVRCRPLKENTLFVITCKNEVFTRGTPEVAVLCQDANLIELKSKKQSEDTFLINAIFAKENLSVDDLRIYIAF